MEIFDKLFQRIQREVEEVMAIEKLKVVPRLKFINKVSSHTDISQNPRKSAKRRTMLCKISNGNIHEDSVEEEGFNKESNKIVFGLNEKEHECMILICSLMRSDNSIKLKRKFLAGKQLENFMSFYREQDIQFYEMRGLNFEYYKQAITKEAIAKLQDKKDNKIKDCK